MRSDIAHEVSQPDTILQPRTRRLEGETRLLGDTASNSATDAASILAETEIRLTADPSGQSKLASTYLGDEHHRSAHVSSYQDDQPATVVDRQRAVGCLHQRWF